jgi:type IV pilus assembly protein PilQ
LRLRPFVSSDGTIRMEIHPELSTGQVDVLGGITLPNKVVTQVTSNVMCRDGCTLVIGGLIREDLDSQSTQIPLLGSLPLVGAVFRQKTESIKRDEIIVVITPRIVREPLAAGEGRRALAAGREHMETFADKMSPIGTRYYGRRYLRMARSAWEAGDACTALRYVNLAIHFDRQSSEALQLRQEIASVLPATDIDVDRRLRQGLAPWSHPRVEYSRQGYPWRPPQRLAVAGDGSPVETAEGFYVELSDDELPGLGRPEAVVETPPALPSPPTKTTIPGRPSVP